MKKLLLFVATAALMISFTSCSSDSDSGGNSVSFKINGVKKNFKTSATEQSGFVLIYGYTGDTANPTETVSFKIPSGSDGDVIQAFTYDDNTDVNYTIASFASDVTSTSGSNRGTFSGIIHGGNGGGGGISLTLSDGTFSVNY